MDLIGALLLFVAVVIAVTLAFAMTFGRELARKRPVLTVILDAAIAPLLLAGWAWLAWPTTEERRIDFMADLGTFVLLAAAIGAIPITLATSIYVVRRIRAYRP